MSRLQKKFFCNLKDKEDDLSTFSQISGLSLNDY